MIRYKKGYKYQLHQDYRHSLSAEWLDCGECNLPFIQLSAGVLLVRRGYSWDGPSGPSFDTKSFMRGSLVHDALYQMMRAGFVERSYKELADRELIRICAEDGMAGWRRWYVYQAVKRFGKRGTIARRDILVAP